jgi:hypothetical protein
MRKDSSSSSTTTASPTITIVDFGGGSGHLGIPLALLLPNCRIVVVDLNEKSLELMHEKADMVIQEILKESHDSNECQNKYAASVEASTMSPSMTQGYDSSSSRFRSCGNSRSRILSNLFSFHGPVEEFKEPFDIAIALHLCGEATDVCLRKAVAISASAIVVAPCCVGKLSSRNINPDVFHATGQNMATVSYPQSALFCQLVGTCHTGPSNENDDAVSEQQRQDDWDALAKAADYSNEQEFGTSRNASRRAAKALLETDRRLFLEEQNSKYRTALMKMEPLDSTPKNDILVAWRSDAYNEVVGDVFSVPSAECQADIEVAKSHLLMNVAGNATNSSAAVAGLVERNDWSVQEEEDVERTILEFLDSTKHMEDCMDQVFLFPTRMGGRKRKLIHFVAGKLDLAHWSHGSKDSEKTVAVARRGQRKRKELDQ